MTESKTIWHKMLEVQSRNISVPKNGFNPFTKSHYRKLEDIILAFRPVCVELGLVIITQNRPGITTVIIHDTETGQQIESTLNLPETADPQKTGSTLTYYTRYNLVGLLGISEDDTDGEAAKKKLKDGQGTENRLKVIEFIKINYGTKNNKEIQDKLSELRGQQTDLKTYTEAEAKNDLLKLMALTK